MNLLGSGSAFLLNIGTLDFWHIAECFSREKIAYSSLLLSPLFPHQWFFQSILHGSQGHGSFVFFYAAMWCHAGSWISASEHVLVLMTSSFICDSNHPKALLISVLCLIFLLNAPELCVAGVVSALFCSCC